MKLLHLDSSILGGHSVSRALTQEVVEALRLAEPVVDVTYRDLAARHGLQTDGALLGARMTAAEERTPEQRELLAQADVVMAEFLAADTLVIGAPMYNFSIPSQLKSWIDLVTVAGVTFRYGADGVQGLAGGKRAIVVATAGGQHAGQPTGSAHIGYLRLLLGFLGIRDIRVITAEGLAMGPAVREPALADARAHIAEAIEH
jgi:FMN-dependent NADH-azoreductase